MANNNTPEPPGILARGWAELKKLGAVLSTPDPHPVVKDINGVRKDIAHKSPPPPR